MASCSRSQVISLYRMLMKESKKFPSYNFRTYALCRVKHGFRENQHVDNPRTLDVLLSQARESLALIKRQVLRPPAAPLPSLSLDMGTAGHSE
ncbi:LYR motif-containing protein 4 isoform X1 [Brienomyrus brachyistius]|uniref:LYR motif-containing protein 4 isoform X1 n=1 Tax=Brienomyrus brachyistius TaxID=42636 RepID=UPI0020B33793|nr:LYR motif-containing protein 4 isoform X1 [Brienomyrus brachyistius]